MSESLKLVVSRSGSADPCATWQHRTVADDAALAATASEMGLSEAFLRQCLDPDEIPHIDREGEQILLLLQAPWTHEEATAPLFMDTVPLGILLRPAGVVTISAKPLPLWDRLHRELCGEGARSLQREAFLARFFTELARDFLGAIDRLEAQLEVAKEQLRRSQSNAEFFRLLSLQKSLIYLTAALRGNLATGERLLHSPRWQGNAEEQEQLRDALEDLRQARDTAELMTSTTTNAMDAFAGTLQNNITVAIRVVTAWTVVITVPIAVISIMAMNTPLPLHDWPYAWPVLMGGSFVASGLLYLALRRSQWL
ncbi:MAG: magnesium transporter CorA family protein [Acidithiobacillus sp.]